MPTFKAFQFPSLNVNKSALRMFIPVGNGLKIKSWQKQPPEVFCKTASELTKLGEAGLLLKVIYRHLFGDHSFSTYAKLSEKNLTFLNPRVAKRLLSSHITYWRGKFRTLLWWSFFEKNQWLTASILVLWKLLFRSYFDSFSLFLSRNKTYDFILRKMWS